MGREEDVMGDGRGGGCQGWWAGRRMSGMMGRGEDVWGDREG